MLVAAFCAVNACASGARLAPAVQESSWPGYLGGVSRAGWSAEPPPADAQPVWRTDVGRGIRGAPAVAEDVIAVSQVDRQVALLDRATGEVLWRARLPSAVGAGPLLADDRLFVATQEDNGRVYALRLSNGRRIWSVSSGNVIAPLALANDALYAGTDRGAVMRLDGASGARIWRTDLSGAVRAAPLPVPGALAVATANDSLHLLDAASGRIMARTATPGTVLAAPAYSDGLIVGGTMDGWIVAWEAEGLAERWRVRAGAPVVGHVSIRDGYVWSATSRGTVHAIPLGNPGAARSFATGLTLRAGPVPTAGGVLVAGAGGELARFSPDGRRIWGARVDGPLSEPPLLCDRSLIVVSEFGEVMLYR